MYCTYCGNEVKAQERFCAQCGKASSADASASSAPPQTARRLALDTGRKKIAGVCAGIAGYLGWDITLVRILFLAGIVVHGVSLLVYLICWIAMPRDDAQTLATAR